MLYFDEYISGSIGADKIINLMVGDLQRIIQYPAMGFQIVQEVPDSVQNALDDLIAVGYDKHLLKNESRSSK